MWTDLARFALVILLMYAVAYGSLRIGLWNARRRTAAARRERERLRLEVHHLRAVRLTRYVLSETRILHLVAGPDPDYDLPGYDCHICEVCIHKWAGRIGRAWNVAPCNCPPGEPTWCQEADHAERLLVRAGYSDRAISHQLPWS